ncbi:MULTISPECIES: hypothetical protein [unclassified Rhodococcus (in: high G+C Gram-positive bacteria)]|uniref:hypothetical protein n=1 Tax=unclassified Rhodococcus (in: high G+C Gram-positive bacteria) TaxID=192944 RepID=UPI000A9F1728|nr:MULTISPECIES: hypothetical protein [unclassified Rhodococcus (in: high G+C Gram-positive bacteria)]
MRGWVGVVLLSLLGIAAIVLGGADDSPGLQFIGLILVVTAIVTGLRQRRST